MMSVNKKVICEPYKEPRGIKGGISSGVAFVKQKNNIYGLRVLMDAAIDDRISLKAGDVVYLTEEMLYTNKNYSNPMECKEVKEQFVIIEFNHIVFIKRYNEG
jgi:hypothetical protein